MVKVLLQQKSKKDIDNIVLHVSHKLITASNFASKSHDDDTIKLLWTCHNDIKQLMRK